MPLSLDWVYATHTHRLNALLFCKTKAILSSSFFLFFFFGQSENKRHSLEGEVNLMVLGWNFSTVHHRTWYNADTNLFWWIPLVPHSIRSQYTDALYRSQINGFYYSFSSGWFKRESRKKIGGEIGVTIGKCGGQKHLIDVLNKNSWSTQLISKKWERRINNEKNKQLIKDKKKIWIIHLYMKKWCSCGTKRDPKC